MASTGCGSASTGLFSKCMMMRRSSLSSILMCGARSIHRCETFRSVRASYFWVLTPYSRTVSSPLPRHHPAGWQPGPVPCQVLLSCSFRDGHVSPGLLLHVPGKLFRIPEVFGIRSALVQSPEKPQKTVRVKTPATKFIIGVTQYPWKKN